MNLVRMLLHRFMIKFFVISFFFVLTSVSSFIKLLCNSKFDMILFYRMFTVKILKVEQKYPMVIFKCENKCDNPVTR